MALDGNVSTMGSDATLNSTDNPLLDIVFNTGMLLNFLFNVPMHVYVIWFTVRTSGARNTNNVFTLQLSVSEVVSYTGALLMPLSFHVKINALKRASDFFLCMLGNTRACFQTCICMEHYLAVIHPVLFQRYKHQRYKVAISLVVWVSVFGLCFLPVFAITRPTVLWCITGLPLFLLMLLCSFNTLRALRQAGPGEAVGERRAACQAKIRAFHMIAFMLAAMTLCYGPLFGLIVFQRFISTEAQVVAESIFMLYVLTLGFIQPVFQLKKARHPCC